MSVYNLPVTSSGSARTDIQEWKFLRQFAIGVAERYWLAGICVFPREGHAAYVGTVPAGITATGFTDATASGVWGSMAGGYVIPWSRVSDPFSRYQGPTTWQIIIDDNDPEKVVRSTITAWTDTGGLTFLSIGDYVTSNQIPSLASLVGKTYRITGVGYLSWAERIIQWPNDEQVVQGTVLSLPAVTNSTGGVVFPASPGSNYVRIPGAGASSLAGFDILFYSGTSQAALHRSPISSNTAEVFWYSPSATANIGTPVSIVHSGRRCYPGRGPFYPFAWYRGAKDGYFSRSPVDNSLTSADAPASSIKVPGDTGGGICGDVDTPCFDGVLVNGGDVWTDYNPFSDPTQCPQPSDFNYTPYVWMSIRAMQRALELISFSYVEAISWDGAQSLPSLNPAEMYRIASDYMTANSIANPLFYVTATTGNVTGAVGNDGSTNSEISISGSALASIPYLPFPTWFNVRRSDGSYTPGRGLVTSPTTLVASDGMVFTQQNDGPPVIPGDSGCTIILAPSYTNYFYRQFERFDDTAGFIPDVVPDGLGGFSAVDPSQIVNPGMSDDTGVGIYKKIPKSTSYISQILQTGDFTIPQGFAFIDSNTNTGSFKAGDLARFGGDNYFYPSVRDGNSFFRFADGDPLAQYYDGFHVGRRPDAIQATLDAQLSGTTTDGGTFWLKDTSKNWYHDDRHTDVMNYVQGTATAGSTTSATFGSMTSGDANYFWENRRFSNLSTNGAFATLPIEVDTGSGSNAGTFNVSEVRLIATGNSSTCTVTWAEPTSISANGRYCRIHQPYIHWRYRDRPMTITSPASSGASVTYTVTNVANAGNVLFFSTGTNTVNVTANWTYSINMPVLGGIYRRDSNNASWNIASGTDSVRLGVTTPHDFHADPRENLPGYVVRHGLWMHQALKAAATFNQMWGVFNALRWAKYSAEFEDLGDLNAAQGFGGYPGPGSNAASDAATAFNSSPNPYNEAGSPTASSTYTYPGVTMPPDTCNQVGLHRRYSYGIVRGICTRLPVVPGIEMFNYGALPDGSLGPQAACGQTFAADGDPVRLGAWSSFGGGSVVNGSAAVQLGSLGVPTGSFACTNGISVHGYLVIDQCTLVKGDSGALTIIG